LNYIVDDIGTVVAKLRSIESGPPYYMYGHRLEIANRLKAKDNRVNEKEAKYPLIALRLDTEEGMGEGFPKQDLNLIIATITKRGYNAEERYTNVFKPVLQPLYLQFIQALRKSGLFIWPNLQDMPVHTKIDRPYWGTPDPEENVKNLFDDPIDAIEILNLKINSLDKTCS
jgi:hypothetical protein